MPRKRLPSVEELRPDESDFDRVLSTFYWLVNQQQEDRVSLAKLTIACCSHLRADKYVQRYYRYLKRKSKAYREEYESLKMHDKMYQARRWFVEKQMTEVARLGGCTITSDEEHGYFYTPTG
jgi:hypothetical protein